MGTGEEESKPESLSRDFLLFLNFKLLASRDEQIKRCPRYNVKTTILRMLHENFHFGMFLIQPDVRLATIARIVNCFEALNVLLRRSGTYQETFRIELITDVKTDFSI